MAEDLTGPDMLDLFDYAPYLFRSIANRLGQSGSNLLMQGFGIGLNEWSCMALLALEPDISAKRISEVSGFDKGVISRSVNSLEEKGYVRTVLAPKSSRLRLINLTHAGWRLYRELRIFAAKREARLLDGLSDDERAELMRLLRKVHDNTSSARANGGA